MRIGVTNLFRGSAFSGALPQVATYLAHVLKGLGHEVEFLLPGDSDDWFIDCESLKSAIPTVKLLNNTRIQTYHMVIEVVWFVPPDMRKQLAQRSVMFYHYPPVFYDIESSTYPLSSQTRDFAGLHAVWTWSHFKKTDYEYLEFMTGCQVFKVPFLWNPLLIDAYCKEESVPEWSSFSKSIVICESNETNTSNCTLPLTILSEIYKKDSTVKWKVTNGEALITRPFFIGNIITNLHLQGDISGNFLKRVRLPDLCRDSPVLLSHQRWRPIKYLLLDALYLGIPVIHNSEMLREVRGGEWFYTLNRIGQAVDCWERIKVTARPAVSEVRSALLAKWGPSVAAAVLPGILQDSLTCERIKRIVAAPLRIAFFDMWADFVPAHNLFVGALKHHGVEFEIDQMDPTLIIFGPFGPENQHPRFKNIPKIYYVGENMPPLTREDIILNMGFCRDVKEKYLRLPNWMLELNWFNQLGADIVNPDPLPLQLLKPSTTGSRRKFCAFVSTNSNSIERNTLFHTVSRYKTVDSAGALFSTMDKIPCGAGGSKGQAAKIEFYKQYKFVLACENSKAPGYVTEKILHAKMAGCVPIYWGDPLVGLEFNSKAYINVADFKTAEALLRHIKNLDEDDAAWSLVAREPILSDERTATVRAIWTEFSTRVANFKSVSIGSVAPPPYKTDFIGSVGGRAIVTCCNSAFVPSACRLIKSSKNVFVFTWNATVEEKHQLEEAGAARVIELDTSWNPGWSDFWNPAHYAWKPLVMYICNNIFDKNTTVLYLDAGIEVLRDLESVWNHIEKEDIFVTHMPEHTMQTWSHPRFCQLLEMTKEEGLVPQYSANIIGFKVGGKFTNLFDDVLRQASRREVIEGNKWFAYSDICKGHRHDQSIYTLLGHRAGVKPLLMDLYAGWTSYSDCIAGQKYFYVHRGNWKSDEAKLQGIHSTYIVNLAHREDRLLKFKQSHLGLASTVKVFPAVYGRDIKMTREIAHLFRHNDFKWKKSVMGCALSHYQIWKTMLEQNLGCCLVLEDDVMFSSDYANKWNQMVSELPADADFIFLGGVLPPNKPALPMVTEPVNKSFAKVKKHNLFGGEPRRYFHFCTYSYAVTRAGAAKLCALIAERGIFTSIDHMIVNHGELLNIYFSTPLLAGCIQDNDPAYQNADFNNFNRVDKFDSEIWNNTDAFSEEEVRAASVDLCVVYFEPKQPTECVEQEWLEEVFARKFKWVSHGDAVSAGSRLVVYYQHTTPVHVIEGWINRHMDCRLYLLHLSDERCAADVSLYRHPGIRGIFRNYWRREVCNPKVIHLPLGYHNGRGGRSACAKLHERTITWSFAGAMDRPGRTDVIESLKKVTGHRLHLTPTWHSDKNMDAVSYVELLGDSKFVPCLGGAFNVESFRFYEAIENGAIPLVPIDAGDSYKNVLSDEKPALLLGLSDMKTAAQVMSTLLPRADILQKTQDDMRGWWLDYKKRLTKRIHVLLYSA